MAENLYGLIKLYLCLVLIKMLIHHMKTTFFKMFLKMSVTSKDHMKRFLVLCVAMATGLGSKAIPYWPVLPIRIRHFVMYIIKAETEIICRGHQYGER